MSFINIYMDQRDADDPQDLSSIHVQLVTNAKCFV